MLFVRFRITFGGSCTVRAPTHTHAFAIHTLLLAAFVYDVFNILPSKKIEMKISDRND